MSEKKNLFVLSGPSGSGKNTVWKSAIHFRQFSRVPWRMKCT